MNITGFVHESIVPMRKTAAHSAEMVTQTFFGDLVRIMDKYAGWYHIRAMDDQYEGWVPNSMIEPVSEAFLAPDQDFLMVKDLVAPCKVKRQGQESTQYLCRGARFPKMNYRENKDELLFKLGEIEFRIQEHYLTEPLPAQPAAIAKTAYDYLNVPYMWGGKSPFGADCSGFTQMLFRMHGILLKRDSYQQATQGEVVTYADREPGYLAFFHNQYGRVSHVGYLLSRDTIIHGSGRVRIDRFTPQGIYHTELKTLTHRLHSLRNLLG